MKGRVLSVANLKGGVGKTTCAIMIAEGLSLRTNPATGKPNRVLVVDTDPQANLSYSLMGYENVAGFVTAKVGIDTMMMTRLFHGKPASLEKHVKKDVSHLFGTFDKKRIKTDISLLPCTPDSIGSERMLLMKLSKKGRTYSQISSDVYSFMSKDVFEVARKFFDWIVVDCAPGINLLSQASISAGDATVIVTVPEKLPIFGLEIFITALWNDGMAEAGFPTPRNPLVLANRYVSNQTSHQAGLVRLRDGAERKGLYKMLDTVIPETSVVKKDSFFQLVVDTLKGRYPQSHAAMVQALAREIDESIPFNDE